MCTVAMLKIIFGKSSYEKKHVSQFKLAQPFLKASVA